MHKITIYKTNFLNFKRLFLLVVLFSLSFVNAFAIDEMAELYSRLYTKYYTEIKGDATLLTSQQTDGRWADINYADNSLTNWEPVVHLSRLKSMSKSYCEQTDKQSALSISLLAGIEKGLSTWYIAGCKSTNWWYNDIGQQLEIGPILALMKNYLQTATIATGCSYLRVSSGAEGTNLVWEAAGMLIRGAVLNNTTYITSGVNYIHTAIVPCAKGIEGIQTDNAFLFHGQQLYNGGYGQSLITDVTNWMYIMRGLSMGFGATDIGTIRNLVLDGNQWLIRRGQYDFGVAGRLISRKGGIGSSNMIANLTNLIGVDPTSSVVYQNMINHINGTKDDVLNGNKIFFTADYMAQRRPSYHLSVKMCSARTNGSEYLNGENAMGFWLPFGATCLMKDAGEFSNIFPLWNWTRVPGTTAAEQIPVFSAGLNQSKTFVGGVSNGQCGVAAMELSKQSVYAKKSWFMFNNETVCLGAGISSTNVNNVNTSLAQSVLKGAVTVDGTTLATTATDTVFNNVKWVFHDNVSYVFPQASNINISKSSRTSSWSNINPTQSTTPITNSIFNVWMPHGLNPSNATYSYIIVPDIVLANVQSYSDNLPIKILSNSSSLQSVTQTVQKLTGAVFFAIGSLVVDGGLTVSVDQPCAMLIDQSKNPIELTVSDPSQVKTSINVTLKFAYNPTEIINFVLPTADSTGASVTKTSATVIMPYPQILPIDYSQFFAPTAINANDTDLVRDIYANQTPTPVPATPILANEWTAQYTATPLVSPTVENSTLSYSGYIDNNAGKAVVFPQATPTRNFSFYPLTTSTTAYTGKPFYLSALINLSSFRTADAFLMFGSQYLGTYQRGKVQVVTNGMGYSVGVQFNAETAVNGATLLNKNQTYLIVAKITPMSSGTETLSVFVNPLLGGTEPVTPEATTTVATATLLNIKGIALRATFTGKMGGFRFSDNWADVVKQVTSTITSFTPTTGAAGTIVTLTGVNLTETTAVNIGGTPATSVTVVNSTTVTAVVANGASGIISATTPDGIANSEGTFTFIPSPTITSFTPTNGAVGTVVSITGTNLLGTTAVSIGGTPVASFTVVNSTTVTAVITNGISGNIDITTPGGTVTSSGIFTITYPQTLPIDYKQFFSPTAINANGIDLVRDVYANTSTAPILPNEWTAQSVLVSPTVQSSTLCYSNYIDNNLGKEIVFPASINRNNVFYPLTASTTAYTGKAFFLSTLINISSFRSSDPFLMFGSQYLGTYQRGKVQVVTNGAGYSLGVQFNAETPVNGTTILNKNQTYLVVVKITPSVIGTETLSVFVNPTIGDTELVTPEATISIPTAQLLYIKGINLRATFTGKMAGLRFSDNWADVVKKDTVTGFAQPIIDNSIIVSGKTIITREFGTIQVYNLQGIKLVEVKDVCQFIANFANGLYIVRFTNEKGECVSRKFTF